MNLETLAQWSQIVGAIIFLVVIVWIWNKYVAPAVRSYQEAKNAELAEGEARRERMRADIGEARKLVEQVDAQTRTVRERMHESAEHDRTKIVAEAQAEAERIVRNAEGELSRARIAARDRLRIEFIQRALVKARADAAARVSDATNERLVSGTIDDLVRGAN